LRSRATQLVTCACPKPCIFAEYQIKEIAYVWFRHRLMTCMIAVAFTMGATLTAESATMTKAETVALKQAVVACKAEAKGKKIKWLARRDEDLPAEQWDAF
jgi:hypothetical protein